jgi:hypothetical protein
MKRKPAKAMVKPKSMTADDHRKLADKHRARSQLHEAKASILDVDEPPKPSSKSGKSKITVRPY